MAVGDSDNKTVVSMLALANSRGPYALSRTILQVMPDDPATTPPSPPSNFWDKSLVPPLSVWSDLAAKLHQAATTGNSFEINLLEVKCAKLCCVFAAGGMVSRFAQIEPNTNTANTIANAEQRVGRSLNMLSEGPLVIGEGFVEAETNALLIALVIWRLELYQTMQRMRYAFDVQPELYWGIATNSLFSDLEGRNDDWVLQLQRTREQYRAQATASMCVLLSSHEFWREVGVEPTIQPVAQTQMLESLRAKSIAFALQHPHPMTRDHVLVLSYLSKQSVLKTQIEMRAPGESGITNREKLGTILADLVSWGYVRMPKGQRKGYQILQAGKLWLELHAAGRTK